jgi:MraZ protein
MSQLFGTFEEISVDDKGRFSIPASIRASLPAEADNTFMIVRGTEGCLFAYPKIDWLNFWQGLQKLPVNRDNTRLVRRIISSLKETRIDAQGRVTLTQKLKELGNIRNNIVVVGDGDKLLLWDATAWKQYQDSSEQISTYDDDYYRALETDRNRNDK